MTVLTEAVIVRHENTMDLLWIDFQLVLWRATVGRENTL
jgi:hypothetical protein